MSEEVNTGTNLTDRVTSLAKGVFGAVPFAGPLLAEVVGNVIPNQRTDRLERFARKLDVRLQHLEAGDVKELAKDPHVADLLEDSFFQAARAVTDARLDHIADVVTNGITPENRDAAESKRMLWLLGQLNDFEVLLLRGRLPMTSGEVQADAAFREKHGNLISPKPLVMGSSQEEISKAAIHDSYLDHLVDLGLLKRRFRKPKRDELPEFDDNTGMIKASGHDVTRLGKMLLQYLELIPDWFER